MRPPLLRPCHECGELVEWAWSETGRPLPLDAVPDPAGNLLVNRLEDGEPVVRTTYPGAGDRRSHFVTCPKRRRYRITRR